MTDEICVGKGNEFKTRLKHYDNYNRYIPSN